MTGDAPTPSRPGARPFGPPPASRLLDALLARPAAAEFHAHWTSADRSPDAIGYVEATPHLSPRECTDVFLIDQHHRWQRGWALPVEAYSRVLRQRFGPQRVLDLEWELVEQEFLWRQTHRATLSKAAVLRDLCRRFPLLSPRLRHRFRPEVERRDDGHPSGDADDPNRTVTMSPTELARQAGASAEAALTSLEIVDSASRRPGANAPIWSRPRTSAFGGSTRVVRLPPSLIALIEAQLESRTFEAGQALMRQGDPGDGLFVIDEGEVQVRSTDMDGVTHVIATVGAGAIVGEMALVTEEPRTADVVAGGRVVSRFLPVARFDALATQHPVISRVLTQLLAERLGQADRDVLAGKILDCYRVLHRLGRGGMAIVYEAEHLETGERVALKMMSHRLVYDQRALALFQREADIVESFDHPNIVRLKGRFKAFRSFFLVMEYCDGVSLEQVITHRGAVPLEEFRRIVGQLAAALVYAHAHNIAHRDVKPSNVMLTRSGRVKLMDFGLANPIDDDEESLVAGTPRYMAPEQLAGRPPGAAADLFSLGCTAWRLLTGHDLIDTSDVAEVRRRHQRWKMPQPDCSDPAVRGLLDGCLRIDPAERRVDLREIAGWAS